MRAKKVNGRVLFLAAFILFSHVDAQDKGIKVKRVYQRIVAPGVRPTDERLISETRYNEGGSVAEVVIYGEDGRELTREKNSYNENNRLRECLTTAAGNSAKRMTCHYERDRLIRAETHNLVSNVGVFIEYVYDDKGRRTETIARSRDSRVYKRLISRYDEQDRLLSTEVTDISGNILGRETLTYSDDEDVLLKKYGQNGTLLRQIGKNYDEQGRLASQVELDAQGRIVQKTSHTYDDRGRLSRVVREMPAANMRTSSRQTYNEYGEVHEIFEYNKLDELVKKTRHEYEYYQENGR